jgi:hypothetical protein
MASLRPLDGHKPVSFTYSILSQYQASYPVILDIAMSLSLNKLLGAALVHATEEESPG